jgi:hypothetical protein
MDDLSNSIFTYYLSNLHRLSEYKQFHFASRLYLWNRRPGMHEILEDLRPSFTTGGNIPVALDRTKQWALTNPDFGSQNARALRRPFFKQYPALTDYTPVLLKIMYLRTVYGIDCRDEFDHLFPLLDVNKLAQKLLKDDAAIAMLSSQAINFLYTWAQLSETNEAALKPERFLSIGASQYDQSSKLHLQLLIYFYTHCIIGATHFYHRDVPSSQVQIYTAMTDKLEELIVDWFDDINLDNKFEFLVSCRILGRHSILEGRIRAEAEASISPEGPFLIDTKNNNPQSTNINFDKSEHRNVLFLLSGSPFLPPS